MALSTATRWGRLARVFSASTWLVLVWGCTSDEVVLDLSPMPVLGELVQVVDSLGLPPEVEVQPANNNLDVIGFEGEVVFAFRSAPNHFADADAALHVLRSADQETWTHELTLRMGTDLREPRLLAWQGRLFLYFAVLGDSASAFEPAGTMVTVREPDGSWSDPDWILEETFIPWRVRVVDDRPYLIGYTGGGSLYELGSDKQPAIDVHWLTSDDGLLWDPVVQDRPVVHAGGASETDFAFLDDGGIVAVMRQEGSEHGFGSRICRAEPDALADWSCVDDVRKFDSPLLFRRAGRTWLLARRTLTEGGAYDLQKRDLDWSQQWLDYELTYWQSPKRCALWTVDAEELRVEWVLDLPSRGDTCFPSMVEAAEGSTMIYNYSSDPEGPDLSWVEGQLAPTSIFRQEIAFDPDGA